MPARIGPKPLTKAEMQRRWRAKRKKELAESNARRNEWGTPVAIIEAARLVLGRIDCDPATHAAAQARVQAACYYTAADNGLGQPWHGRVFLNPPYERGLIERFVIKLLMELAAKRATEAIVLVNAQTDTVWFQYLKPVASAECYPTGRVRFLNSDGKPGMPLVGQAILYFGDQPERFVTVFSQFGISACLTATPAAGSPLPDTARPRLVASAEPSGSPPRPNRKRPALRVAE